MILWNTQKTSANCQHTKRRASCILSAGYAPLNTASQSAHPAACVWRVSSRVCTDWNPQFATDVDWRRLDMSSETQYFTSPLAGIFPSTALINGLDKFKTTSFLVKSRFESDTSRRTARTGKWNINFRSCVTRPWHTLHYSNVSFWSSAKPMACVVCLALVGFIFEHTTHLIGNDFDLSDKKDASLLKVLVYFSTAEGQILLFHDNLSLQTKATRNFVIF